MSDAHAASVLEHVAAQVAAWDGRLRFPPNGAFNPRSAIVPLPPLCAELYAGIGDGALAEIAYGLGAFSDAVMWTDDVIDYTAADPAAARDLPAIAAIFAEAYRTFACTLGGDRRFWDALRRYFVEYVDALGDEARIAREDAAWSACDEARALSIARGKNGLVRLVDAAVAALAGRAQRPGADEMLLDWFVGEQMLDDYGDWKEDVRDGNVSVLLRSVCGERPSVDQIESVGLRLYLHGHADRILALAQAHMDRAERTARALGATRFAALVVTRRERIAPLRAKIAEVVGTAC